MEINLKLNFKIVIKYFSIIFYYFILLNRFKRIKIIFKINLKLKAQYVIYSKINCN